MTGGGPSCTNLHASQSTRVDGVGGVSDLTSCVILHKNSWKSMKPNAFDRKLPAAVQIYINGVPSDNVMYMRGVLTEEARYQLTCSPSVNTCFL